MFPPLRVVVAEGFVVQARFAVQVLVPEAQVLQEARSSRQFFAQATAPGNGGSSPDGVAVIVGHALRHVVQFRMIPEDVHMLTVAVDTRQRLIAVFGVDILYRCVRVTVAGLPTIFRPGQAVYAQI